MSQKTTSDYFIEKFAMVVVVLFSIVCILPFLLIIGTSFTSETVARTNGFSLLPRVPVLNNLGKVQFEETGRVISRIGLSFDAYKQIFVTPKFILGSYIVTIGMTLIGTLIGLGIISMTGYALNRHDFPLRNGISFFIYFASLFSAGLAPYYLLMTRYYHLDGNYLAVLLPLMISPWLIILIKNYVKSVPYELTEAGKIDGAGDFTIFVKLILPMLKPALATIGLFLALGYWNEWYQSSLFLNQKDYLPLQYYLYNIISGSAALKNSPAGNMITVTLPQETLKMATAVIATGPVVLVYPFVQKYFIAGITVGAVKG